MGGKGLEGIEGGETIIRLQCVRKKVLFSIKAQNVSFYVNKDHHFGPEKNCMNLSVYTLL